MRRNGPATSAATCLAGLVVALALIPEAIAFSIIAGVDPKVGLYASVLDCRDHGLRRRPAGHDFGRDRGHCRADGDAGAEHGLQYLLAATVLAGLLQIAAGCAEARLCDALRLALGDDRLRQRAGDPDLHGAAART
jgi:SulP family sulfate permease